MKRYSILALALVLTAALLTGCGCTNQNMAPTTAPTTRPTQATTAPTTAPTTRPTTMPTTAPTETGTTDGTMSDGNGSATTPADGDTSENSNARRGNMGSNGGMSNSSGIGSNGGRMG